MLSKKYQFIKKCLTRLSHIKPLDRKLKVLAQMYLDIDQGYRFSYIASQNGETEFLDQLSELYQDRPFVFFDVGAHVGGYSTEIVQRFGKYRGFLFDLSDATLEACHRAHDADKNLSIHHVGLGDYTGQVEYRYYPKAQLQTAMMDVGPYIGHEFEIKTAPCERGDDFCEKQKIPLIDLLKIDTEGYDLHVLRGFTRMLEQKKINFIQFEYNIKSGETHSMLGDFYRYFNDHGYRLGVLRPEGVQFINFDYRWDDFFLGPNYIACLQHHVEHIKKFMLRAQ